MESIRKAELLIGPLLLVNNLILFILNKSGTNIIINTIIPVVIIGISVIKKDKIKKYTVSILFFIVGCLVAFSGSIDNFSAISLFVISCFVLKDKRFYIISGVLLFFLTLMNFTIHNMPISNFLNMINAYFFIGYVSVYLFWPIADIRAKTGINKGLTVEQMQTIEKLMEGKTQTQSAKELHIERPAFTMRLKSVRKRYGVFNDFQLAISLIEDGVISINSFTNVKIDKKD